MIIKLSTFIIAILVCGNVPISLAAIQPSAVNPSVDVRLEPAGKFSPRTFRVRDDSATQNTRPLPIQASKAGERKKAQPDRIQQELAAKEVELSSLREKILVANELLDMEKQRAGSLETQLIQKEQELKALRELEDSKNQVPKDTDAAKNRLPQYKKKNDDAERQVAARNLENAKRRIGELILQLHAKDAEINTLRSSIHENSKKARADLAAQTDELNVAKRRGDEGEQQKATGKEQELAQAKRRVAEVEQQMAGKEQELAQAKRRGAEVEQQMAGKEQELAQAKRRGAEVEQQMAGKEEELAQAKRRVTEVEQQKAAGKEQELAQAKDELKQVSQKLDELSLELATRTEELAQTKQLFAKLDRNLPNPADPAISEENTLIYLDEMNQRLVEVELPLSSHSQPGPNIPASTDSAEALSSDLGKLSQSLGSLLQPELTRGGATLRERGNKLILTFGVGALFASGDATMTVGGSSLLKRVGNVLRGFRYQSIEVAGHTDNVPVRSAARKGAPDNTELSQARAERVSQALINGGVEADQVKAVGYGGNRPIATNDNEKGRMKNRRVEIVITSDSSPVSSPTATPQNFSKKPKMLSTEKGVNR